MGYSVILGETRQCLDICGCVHRRDGLAHGQYLGRVERLMLDRFLALLSYTSRANVSLCYNSGNLGRKQAT
jgi:hypothetical protein